MANGELVMADFAESKRTQHGLAEDQMALLVKFVGQYGKHATGKKASFQKQDVVVELGGTKGRLTEGELLGWLLNKYSPGEELKATVLRGNDRLALTLPMQ